MSRYIVIIILLIFLFTDVNSQCLGNMIKNGSFELDSIGEDITGKFWEKLEGTPSIDDGSDAITPFGGPYQHGIPQQSADGGNWQLLYCNTFVVPNGDTVNTRIGQMVELQKSVPHVLSYEFASMAFTQNIKERNYSAINVLINGELVYTSKLDTTMYSFEKESFIIVPKTKDLFMEFRISKEVNPTFVKIAAIDGVCLIPITTGRFCEID